MRKLIFREWLKNELKDRGISQKRLAEIMGVHDSTISRVLSGEIASPSTDIYIGAARALDIPIERVLVAAGMLSTDTLSAEEREIIYSYRRLSDDRRNVLMDILRGMAGQTGAIVPVGEITIIPHDMNKLESIVAALIKDRQRQVLDFARWQLREQLLVHDSDGEIQPKQEEWKRVVELIDVILATDSAPQGIRELIMILLKKLGDNPIEQLTFLLNPPSSSIEP